MMGAMSKAMLLDGIVVLDTTQVMAGPGADYFRSTVTFMIVSVRARLI